MDVMITKMNGESFKLSEYDVTVRDFNVGSIPVTGIYGDVEGRMGTVDYGADYGQRMISVPFYTKANDFADYPLLRDTLHALVISREPFYIREIRRGIYQTGDNEAPSGKRYKVRISGEFNIDQQFRYGFGELTFETTDLPFAESVGTSGDIGDNGLNYGDGWSYGMGLLYDDESHKYTHTGTSFRIYNAGNVAVHPFEQELAITISSVQGSTSFLQLRNTTNNTTFRVTEAVSGNQTVKLDGANVTSNSLQYLRKTNRQFIELEPGWNEFVVTGATSVRVGFDFRFYYL